MTTMELVVNNFAKEIMRQQTNENAPCVEPVWHGPVDQTGSTVEYLLDLLLDRVGKIEHLQKDCNEVEMAELMVEIAGKAMIVHDQIGRRRR